MDVKVLVIWGLFAILIWSSIWWVDKKNSKIRKNKNKVYKKSKFFLDENQKTSLSKFQIYTWTIVIFSLIFTMIAISTKNEKAFEIKINTEIYSLMGIVVVSQVANRFIVKTENETGKARKMGEGEFSFHDMFVEESGQGMTMTRIQNFLFTVLLVWEFGLRNLAVINLESTEFILSSFSSEFLVILLISHAGYLVPKAVHKPSEKKNKEVQDEIARLVEKVEESRLDINTIVDLINKDMDEALIDSNKVKTKLDIIDEIKKLRVEIDILENIKKKFEKELEFKVMKSNQTAPNIATIINGIVDFVYIDSKVSSKDKLIDALNKINFSNSEIKEIIENI